MIKLYNGWVIEADTYNYTLKRENGTDKEGRTIYTDNKYFTSMKGALNGFVSIMTKQQLKEHDMNLTEAVAIWKAAVDKLDEVVVKAEKVKPLIRQEM